jgi:hypothetical protein
VAGVALAAGFLAALPALFARPVPDEPTRPAQAALPADLSQVPPDALAFLHVRLADLLQSEAGQSFRKHLAKEIAAVDQECTKRLGVPLDTIDRATVVVLSPKMQYPLVLVTTTKPYDRQAILNAALPGHQEHQVKGKTYCTSKQAGRNALLFINDRLYLHGQVEDVVQFLVRPARADISAPLRCILDLAAGKHQVVAGLNVPPDVIAEIKAEIKQDLARPRGRDHLEDFLAQGLKPLLEVRALALTLDLGKEADLRLHLQFPGVGAAGDALWPARDSVAVSRLAMTPMIEQVMKQSNLAPMAPFLKQWESALRTVTVEQQGSVVQARLRFPADPAALATTIPAVVAAVNTTRQASERMVSQNNLRQIVLAMHNYHDTYNGFPPAAICDKDGKPLLSWRVAILPYVEQDQLYQQFRLNEPWDSEHNKQLLQRMPKLYAPPAHVKTKEPYTTFYQVFVGKGAGFEGKRGLRIVDFTDGTSNTILVVEAAEPVPWTKPEDLPYDDKQPLPKVGGFYPDGFNAAFADGSVHFLKKTLKPDTLRALITRNGGEVIPEDF